MPLGPNPLAGGVIGSAWLKVGADTSGLQKGAAVSKQSMLGLGLAAGSAGKQIAAMFGKYIGAAALIAAVKSSTAAFIEFDKHLRNTHTLITATEVELQKIGKGVRALARDFNVSAAASQASLYQIYSATFYGAEAMHILEQGAKGAVAGLAELKPTVDMLTTVLNAYRFSAEETTHINDLLFTAIRYGKTTLVELSHQFGRLAGVAAPVGASIEDMTAAIATLTRQGIMTDWAITSLRQTLMQFIKPTQNLKKALLALGYESGSAMVKHYGFAGALKKITAWAKENNVEMDQMFTNIRAITAVLPLATIAAGEYAKDQERMANAAGAAAVAFKKAERSIAYQLKKFTTLVNDMAISIGKIFVPALMGMVKALEMLVTPLRLATELFDAIGGDYLIGIAAGVGVLTAAIWALNKAFVGLIGGLMASKALMFSVLGVGGGMMGGMLKSLLTLGRGSLLAGAGLAGIGALGIGAGIQGLVNIRLELGKVTGAEEVKMKLADTLKASLGFAVGGAIAASMLGAGVGVSLGVGAAIAGAAALTIYIVHTVKRAGLAAAERAEAARAIVARAAVARELPEIIPGGIEAWAGIQALAERLIRLDGIMWATAENIGAVTTELHKRYKVETETTGAIKAFTEMTTEMSEVMRDAYKMLRGQKEPIEGVTESITNLGISMSLLKPSTEEAINAITDLSMSLLAPRLGLAPAFALMPPSPEINWVAVVRESLEPAMRAWGEVVIAFSKDSEDVTKKLEAFWQALVPSAENVTALIAKVKEYGNLEEANNKIRTFLHEQLAELLEETIELVPTLRFFGMSIDEAVNNALTLAQALGYTKEQIEALREKLLGIQERWAEVTREITLLISVHLVDALHRFLKQLFGLGQGIEDLGRTLNVVTGYKVERAAWRAAIPGVPGIKRGDEIGGFWDSLLLIAANALVKWTIADIVERLVDWVIADIVSPVVDWFIDDIVSPVLDWVITDIVIPIWDWLITDIVKPVWDWFITDIVKPLIAGVHWFITDIVTPIADWMWNKVLKGPTQWLWETVIKSPDWASILGTIGKITIWAGSIIIGVTAGRDFGTWLADLLNVNKDMRTFLENISGVFGGALMGALLGYLLGGTIGAWIGLLAGSLAGAIAAFTGGFAEGGVVPGTIGTPMLAKVHGGELIIPPNSPALQAGAKILAGGMALLHAGEIVAPAALTQPLGVGVGGNIILDNTINIDGVAVWHQMRRVNRNEERRRTGSSVGGRAWRSG